MFFRFLNPFETYKRHNLEANLNKKIAHPIPPYPFYVQVKSKTRLNAYILRLNFVHNLAWFENFCS